MMRRGLFALVALAPIAWAGCSASSPAQSSYDFGDASEGDSASQLHPQDGSVADQHVPDGNAPNDASGDAGPDAPFTGPPPPPSVCDPAAVYGAGTLQAISTTSDDVLDAITPDELSIAWTSGAAATAVVHYADRATASAAFGAPQSFAAGEFTADRVALAPSGLRLVVVNAGAKGFSEASRTARGAPFGTPVTGAFSNIDSAAIPAAASVGDPVLNASDTAFYYSVYGAGAAKTVYRALRLLASDPWGEGAPLNVAAGLQMSGASRRRPTGISSDGRTLFFYDEVSMSERAAFIDLTTGQFDVFVDLGARLWAAPATSCATLYYSSAGTSSVDLFRATN